MKPEFQIYKKGTTDNKVIIYSKEDELFNRDVKIRKYLMLYYQVYELDDTEITNVK